jgi:DNA-binding NtrC family response regulator
MNPSRILVVDDEPDIRRLLQEILVEEGYEVEVAADAREARSARARQQPDLVLLDIWMPDTDGISLLREWSTSAGEHCPVVMLSGHGTVETAVEATRLGAVDFIEKPLSLAKLLSTVERALKRRDARRRASAPPPSPRHWPQLDAACAPIHAPRRLPGAAAAARRDGQRDRGACALRASPQPALLRGVHRRARQGAGRCARAADAVR